ncbi:cytochrome P450 26B1-like [Liolophura sinensis]|uniref:cytochrome P450 26B1-like n=1 Tax=Liolophura sinensis TaxID=3198878 RepID=UPI003158BF9A
MKVESVDVCSPGRLFVTGALFILTCVLWYCHRKKDGGYGGLKLPPGSLGLPLLGETISLARQKVEFFRERRDKFGDIFKTHLFFRPIVRVSGASNLKQILKGDDKIVNAIHPSGIRTLLGTESLSQSQGKIHRYRKRGFMQGLTGRHLESYGNGMAAMIQEALLDWSSQSRVELADSVQLLTLQLVMSILYGPNISKEDIKVLGSHAATILANLFSLPLNLPGSSYNKAVTARNHLELFAKKFAKNLIGKVKNNNLPPVLVTILKDANFDEDGNVTEELLTKLTDSSVEIIVAGTGTLFSTIMNSILLLGKNQGMMKKLYEELTDHYLDDPVTAPLSSIGLQRLQSLTYLDNIVKEVLRVYPPVGGGYRTAKEAFELDGYLIPKDWTVSFSIRETHENQSIPLREQFDPDRWQEDNPDRPDKQRFAYIPFGAGVRSCPGKEFAKMAMKLTILELCRSYKWTVLDSYNMALFPTPKPDKDVRVNFTRLKR